MQPCRSSQHHGGLKHEEEDEIEEVKGKSRLPSLVYENPGACTGPFGGRGTLV